MKIDFDKHNEIEMFDLAIPGSCCSMLGGYIIENK